MNGSPCVSLPAPSLSHLMYAMEVSPSVPSIRQEEEEDFLFLKTILQSKEMHALVKAHDAILLTNVELGPSISNAAEICDHVLGDIRPYAMMYAEVKELYQLLRSPHIQALLGCHDVVASREFQPKLDNVPFEVDEDEETVKIVQLVKSQDTLSGAKNAEPIVGATIKAEDSTGRILIARVMHGGAADRSGLIAVGDEVIEVNGINVEGHTPTDVLKILQEAEHTITFKLVPAVGKPPLRESRVRLKALFNYNPYEDKYIPCKEAGLGFVKGDIIHIVSQDDPYWWQARRECDRAMRAGLIPSKALQEKRILHDRSERLAETEGKASLLCGVGKQKIPEDGIAEFCPPYLTSDQLSPGCAGSKTKTKKIMYDVTENDDFDREEIATYEEVARLFPRSGRYRPIILIGPPGVGRNELKRRLIAMEPDRLKATVPHTSRPKKPAEIDGVDYFFSPRDQMQLDIESGKFLEHGEFKGNLYGTSVDGIRDLVGAGYQPILSPHYQALKMLRTPELKPYIIYIKPPSFEVLKETRHQAYARSTFDETNSRSFTDDEFREMLQAGDRIEFLYGHMFDLELVNDELGGCLESLVRAVWRLDQDAQWVPASWVQ